MTQKTQKVKLFNRTKYNENIDKLMKRNAPKYVVEAFNRGHTKLVNEYYKQRINKVRGLAENKNLITLKEITNDMKDVIDPMVLEAISKKDLDFLNLMYQMTNIDILTKHKRIPANAGKLIKQGEILDMGLTKLHKRLK